MERFLKAKHWQIFLLICGIPFLVQILFMPIMFFSNDFTLLMKFTPMILILFMLGFFGWFWAIAIGLQSKIPSDIKSNVTKFKIFFTIPIVYIIAIFESMSFGFDNIFFGDQVLNTKAIGIIIGLVFPLHFLSMFCIFYCLYFVAKTCKTVELQKRVTFADFAGEFFLFWFFPIGVWIVQPKINKMVDTEV